jgi:hypothetical protein
MLRHRLSPEHPVVGDGWRLLKDDDVLLEGDQTACVSMLTSLAPFERWKTIDESFSDGIGKPIGVYLDNGTDADARERVFRRRTIQE